MGKSDSGFQIQIVSADLTAEQKGRCQADLWGKNVNKRRVSDNGSVRALMCVQRSTAVLYLDLTHFCRKRSTSQLNLPNFPVTQIIRQQTDIGYSNIKGKKERNKPHATTDKSETEGDLNLSLTEMTKAETRVALRDYIRDY